MANPSSETQRKPPEPTGHKSEGTQTPSSVLKDGIEVEVASKPEPLTQEDRPSSEAQITRPSAREAFWQFFRNVYASRGFCSVLVVMLPATFANIFYEPLMKRWGAKGFWAEYGCWGFVYVVAFIPAFIVYAIVFAEPPDSGKEEGKEEEETGEVERDVEAGLVCDASGAPSTLGSGE